MSLKMGRKARIYILASGTRASWGSAEDGVVEAAAPVGLTAINLTKDVDFTLEKNEAEITTRESDWDIFVGTTKMASMEFQVLNDPENAGVAALRDAFLSDNLVPLAILSGDKAEEGSEGLWADFVALKMSRGEPLKDAQTLSFTLKPGYSAVPPEWVRIPPASPPPPP